MDINFDRIYKITNAMSAVSFLLKDFNNQSFCLVIFPDDGSKYGIVFDIDEVFLEILCSNSTLWHYCSN